MKQIQRAGENTTNYQAQTISINGVSYTEAKEIALDVFRANALELSQIARRVAEERVEEITELLFEKMMERAPGSINSVTDPGMQRAIFRVQEEYACSGDQTLGEVLVDMLVDRAQTADRDIEQITLNEAIKTAPKIATHHFTILATLLLTGKTQFTNVSTVPALHERLKSELAPVAEGLRVTDSDLRHLQYAGCLAVDLGERSIGTIFSDTYPGLFTKGFSRDEINDPSKELEPPVIIPCLRDNTKLQVAALNKDVLQKRVIQEWNLGEHEAELTRLMDVNLMPVNEIEEEISSLHPNLRNLVNLWNSSSMSHCQLTGVGIAVGHANIRRTLPEFTAGIDVWVN
ncbi:LPO_1073/Vpar_1526 family protein [Streptomyces sp. NPDC101175]|uniref:LPO_1073/Vpar_1526 family protein n=1 Tax=Streptomyces sp. NPDC101175 TaxID=3366123 RepID=UPI003834E8DF